ncbi:hypothetical protein Tco_1485627 [Tanacetum coccineum]
MPPRMTTRSAGRATAAPRGGRTGGRTAAPRGGRTGGRTGRGGGRTRGRSGDQGNGRIDGQGVQVGGQGSEVNDGVDEVPDFSTIIAQLLQNLLPTIVAQVGSQGIDQGNGRNQNGDAVNGNIQGDVRNVIENTERRGYTYKEFLACNPKEYDDSRYVAVTEPTTIQKAMQIAGTLTDEAIRNGTGNAFATTTNPVMRENTVGTQCTTVNFHSPPETVTP